MYSKDRTVNRLQSRATNLALLLLLVSPALPCTCVVPLKADAKAAMTEVSLVFRGRVIERKELLQRVEMKGRRRYAVTFQVDEYWKGSPGKRVTLYGMDAGTDCLGDSGYAEGKSYLVYASESDVKDVVLDGLFWYGWLDVLPAGTKMLVPQTACTPGGESSVVRDAIRQLGKGRVPPGTE